jgi:hypothetical protein
VLHSSMYSVELKLNKKICQTTSCNRIRPSCEKKTSHLGDALLNALVSFHKVLVRDLTCSVNDFCSNLAGKANSNSTLHIVKSSQFTL